MNWDSIVYLDADIIRQYSQLRCVGPPKLLSFSQTGNDGVEQPVAMKEEGKLVGRGDQDTNCPINTRHLGDKEKGKVARAGRPLNMADRYKILALYEGGHKISHIAKIVGVTHSCVSKIMSRYRRTGSMCPRSARVSESKSDSDLSEAGQMMPDCARPPPPLPYSIERLLA